MLDWWRRFLCRRYGHKWSDPASPLAMVAGPVCLRCGRYPPLFPEGTKLNIPRIGRVTAEDLTDTK
jgi:hypothetical protein